MSCDFVLFLTVLPDWGFCSAFAVVGFERKSNSNSITARRKADEAAVIYGTTIKDHLGHTSHPFPLHKRLYTSQDPISYSAYPVNGLGTIFHLLLLSTSLEMKDLYVNEYSKV